MRWWDNLVHDNSLKTNFLCGYGTDYSYWTADIYSRTVNIFNKFFFFFKFTGGGQRETFFKTIHRYLFFSRKYKPNTTYYSDECIVHLIEHWCLTQSKMSFAPIWWIFQKINVLFAGFWALSIQVCICHAGPQKPLSAPHYAGVPRAIEQVNIIYFKLRIALELTRVADSVIFLMFRYCKRLRRRNFPILALAPLFPMGGGVSDDGTVWFKKPNFFRIREICFSISFSCYVTGDVSRF